MDALYNARVSSSLEKCTIDHGVWMEEIAGGGKLIDFLPIEKAKRIIDDGVSLIKSIPGQEEHSRIAKYILRVFNGEYNRNGLIAYLMRIGAIDEDKAIIIADDQINKVASRFMVEKWKGQGCKRVRWVHSGKPNPRDYHMRRWNGISGKRNGRPNGLNGFEFDIDRPPIICQKTKERGYPGQMINCRCHIEPIWEV